VFDSRKIYQFTRASSWLEFNMFIFYLTITILTILRIKAQFCGCAFFLYSFVSRNHDVAALLLCLLMKRIEIAETKDGRKALFISTGWATFVSSLT
jgi:hypothetical protein